MTHYENEILSLTGCKIILLVNCLRNHKKETLVVTGLKNISAHSKFSGVAIVDKSLSLLITISKTSIFSASQVTPVRDSSDSSFALFI